jgi:hypothetical protein
MIRVIKNYHFPTRDPNVGSHTLTLSSRPGDLSSKDSYYLLSSGLKVTETSYMNFNTNNYADLTPNSLPSWIRANLAGNLARTGQEWIDYYSKYNSGTHSAHWIVVDPGQFHSDRNLVLFYEQAFSMIRVTDVTSNITEDGYVASYNVPYNMDIYNKLQYQNCNSFKI